VSHSNNIRHIDQNLLTILYFGIVFEGTEILGNVLNFLLRYLKDNIDFSNKPAFCYAILHP
jgi:hypothetical protein